MYDYTEPFRRSRIEEINTEPGTREALQAEYGTVWDTQELQRDYDVAGFLAPYVSVCRKSDGQKGMLEFQHSPRFYYNFLPV